jgi:hypothetical protein
VNGQYLMETAVQTLRGEIAKAQDAKAAEHYYHPYSGYFIAGLNRAVDLMENLMYERIQFEIETRIP